MQSPSFIHYMGLVSLFFEASTPFLHLRKGLIQSGRGSGKLFAFAQGGFALMFFLSRILFGYYECFYWGECCTVYPFCSLTFACEAMPHSIALLLPLPPYCYHLQRSKCLPCWGVATCTRAPWSTCTSPAAP